jgi:preprotein translocase subunit SecF
VDGVGNIITPSERTQIEGALTANVAPIVGREYEAISPTVAKETVRNAAIAVAIATVGILLYITWAFRKVPNAFRYGICSVLALGHDMLAVVGIYSILSRVLNMEVNSMFIVGVLTLLGYTINDSIVVFDRIRENIALSPDRPLRQTVNDSLWQTMGRSLNTGTGVLVVLLALLFLGGPTIRPLVVVFIIGMVAGTYSSIFNSSLLLVSWESGDFGKAMRFLRLSRPKPARQTAR